MTQVHAPYRHHLVAVIATFLEFADLDFIDMPHIAVKVGAAYPRCGMW
jgi:hypothetical protein